MKLIVAIFILANAACERPKTEETYIRAERDTTHQVNSVFPNQQKTEIQTGITTPQELLHFAQTLIGTPYKYGSIDPSQGFDCSGFITYVFNHFNINVPRTSIGFTDVEREITLHEAKPGDIILFTGTDSTIRDVGHMGILTSVDNKNYQFIHSTSGKVYGVTITPLNEYYLRRFVKVIRIFKQNDIS